MYKSYKTGVQNLRKVFSSASASAASAASEASASVSVTDVTNVTNTRLLRNPKFFFHEEAESEERDILLGRRFSCH